MDFGSGPGFTKHHTTLSPTGHLTQGLRNDAFLSFLPFKILEDLTPKYIRSEENCIMPFFSQNEWNRKMRCCAQVSKGVWIYFFNFLLRKVWFLSSNGPIDGPKNTGLSEDISISGELIFSHMMKTTHWVILMIFFEYLLILIRLIYT